jgi:phage shock protein A
VRREKPHINNSTGKAGKSMDILYREKLIKFLMDKVMELESLCEYRSSELAQMRAENENLRLRIAELEKLKFMQEQIDEV